MRGVRRQFLPPGNLRCRLGACGRPSLATKSLKLQFYFQVARWPAACKVPIDQSERCPVPRVASETNLLLPPRQNAGARHRTAGSEAGDKASSFAALIASADAPPPRAAASRAQANRAS